MPPRYPKEKSRSGGRGRVFRARSDRIESFSVGERLKTEAQLARERAERERQNADQTRQKLARQYAEKMKEKEREYAEQMRRMVADADRRAMLAEEASRKAESRAAPVYVVKAKSRSGSKSGVVSQYDPVPAKSTRRETRSAGARLQHRSPRQEPRKSSAWHELRDDEDNTYIDDDDDESYREEDEETFDETVSELSYNRTYVPEKKPVPPPAPKRRQSKRGHRLCGCSDIDNEEQLMMYLQSRAGCCNVLLPSAVCGTFAGLMAVMFC